MNRRLVAMVFTFALAACGGGGESDGGGGPWGGKERIERATVVEVAPAAIGSVAEVITSSAAVQSEKEADLFPVATGVVLEVRKEEGDAVREGEVLAVIDNAALQATSQRARAEVERLEAEVARLETLHRQGAVSSRELSEARYSLEAARTSAWEAGRSQGQTRIKSPFDGVVAIREVRVGELASSGRRAFQVVDLERLRVVAALPERDLAQVAVGQPATLVSAYDTEVSTQGVVSRVGPVVDPTSGTFRVTVDLDAGQGVLRPGQFVTVEIEVDRHDDVLVVPREALVYEDGAPVVYRMVPAPPPEEDPDAPEERAQDADGANEAEETGPRFVAERVAVELGLVDAVGAEIVSGLAAGDRVVVVGQSNLRDGAPIRTPEMVPEESADASGAGDDEGDG